MKPFNDDPFQPWNDPFHKDDPFAAHNGMDGDDPFKPWNDPFGKKEDLNDSDARSYGIRRSRRIDDDFQDY